MQITLEFDDEFIEKFDIVWHSWDAETRITKIKNVMINTTLMDYDRIVQDDMLEYEKEKTKMIKKHYTEGDQ